MKINRFKVETAQITCLMMIAGCMYVVAGLRACQKPKTCSLGGSYRVGEHLALATVRFTSLAMQIQFKALKLKALS